MKKKIAVFTTGWCGEILSQFLNGTMNALKNERVDFFIFLCYPTYTDLPTQKQGELNIFSIPDFSSFDGVIIFGSGLDFKSVIDRIIDSCKEYNIPVLIQGAKREYACYIGSDNYSATTSMCDHLFNHHKIKDVIFFAGTPDSLDSEIRLKAVRDYLAENNRSEDLTEVFYTSWENAEVTRYINELCASGRKFPDAFICANDGLAMEACVTLSNNGYNVPDNVLVTGYDFLDDSQIFDPSIASVDQCFEEMGYACGQQWLAMTNKENYEKSIIIPCKFIPGDSCNCYEYRNSDIMRRRIGREAFSKRSMTTYFNRKLNVIDSTVLSCLTYQEYKKSLHDLLVKDHAYEGESFHILLEPTFGLSIYDPSIKLRTLGYSSKVEVLYSTEDGVEYKNEFFNPKDLVPNYNGDGPNHLYVFLPIHEAEESYGYIIFRDCMEKIANHYLQVYQTRLSLVFDKFRHALSLDLVNKRLLELMRRDPLTNVNNRRAYEDKEKHLQSEIDSVTDFDFAIAMFDINNLKIVNDSMGHDAGDAYIVRACHLISDTFKNSPIYRIGGDEFVAVLTGTDYDNYPELLEVLNKHLSPYTRELPIPQDYISIACGIAVYNKNEDNSVQNIVKRADEAMYENKAIMKGLK